MNEQQPVNQQEHLAEDEQRQTALQKRQQALEAFCVDRGVTRFRKKYADAVKTKNLFKSKVGKYVISHSIEKLAEAFDKWIEAAHPNYVVKQILEDLDRPTLAFFTARAIIDATAPATPNRHDGYIPVTPVALQIAEYILDQAKIETLRRTKAPEDASEEERKRKNGAGLVKWKTKQMKKLRTGSYEHLHKSWVATLKYSDADLTKYTRLTEEDRLRIGEVCIKLFADEFPGYVEVKNERVRGKAKATPWKTLKVIMPTQMFVERMSELNEWFEDREPEKLPTVIKPKPWSRDERGGYWYDLAGKYPLIRGANVPAQPVSDVVFLALNALQNTAWEINRDVYKVITEIEKLPHSSVTIEGIPSKVDEFVVRRVEDEKWAGMSKEQIKAEKTKRRDLHQKNHERKCRRKAFEKTFSVASLILGSNPEHPDLYTDERGNQLPFYFPYNLDFRGRFYPISDYLQPQGNDVCRGLLRFAEGKPLRTREAVDDLAVHGANCVGTDHNGIAVDKQSILERIKWVHENERHILAAAEDWRSNQWFWAHSEVDSPLQFLSFCFEWAAFVKSGRPLEFVSHLPVSMDGSCNGLQHMAALMRDSELAKSVNLTKPPLGITGAEMLPENVTPKDVYTEATSKLEEIMKADTGNEFAIYWLKSGLIKRKLMKPIVMTIPYGLTDYGLREKVMEYLHGKLDRKEATQEDISAERVSYLIAKIHDALEEALPKAEALMDYLKKMVKAAGARPIEWLAPSGFHVVMAEFEQTTEHVDTYIGGGIRWRSSLQKDRDKIDADAQVNGIVPNVIHSIDAAHMAFVLAGTCHTISSFLMIHDSFGTLAADAAYLGTMIRAYLANLYKADYSPHRGLDQNGHRFHSYRPWNHTYSPMLFMGDGEEDGGTLLGHITRGIQRGIDCPPLPTDLRKKFPDMYCADEEVQPGGRAWSIPYKPGDLLPSISPLVPEAPQVEVEIEARPKAGDFDVEEAAKARNSFS